MLSPDYLEHAPDEVLRLVEQAQEDILADMARRIAKVGSFTETAAWQAWRLEQLQLTREEIITRLAKLTGKTKAELRRLFKAAASFGLAEDDAIYTAAGLSPTPANASPVLLQLLNAGLRQTLDTFQNLTRTTANTATGQFERALDRAWMQVTSGAFDAPTAIRRAIKDLAQAGMQAIRYPTGHVDTLEVATRRAVLTGVGKTTGEICLARAEEMGCDLMEITAHPGARPEHAEWQGKIVSLSGRPGYLSLEDIGYGTGQGFKGWNCRHDWLPFYEGISESAYPREKLAEYDRQTVEYNGQQLSYYDATQRQRGIERNVRRWKREYTMLKAAGEDTTEAAARLAHWRATEKDFCKQTGLPRDTARSQVHGFGRSQASRAVWEERKNRTVFNDIHTDEKNILSLEKERAIVYDKNGNTILVKTGDAGSVRFSDSQVAKMKDAILTHNHPSNGPLSDTDIFRLWDTGLAEVRAVTKHGIFSAKQPSVWKHIPDRAQMRKLFWEYADLLRPRVRRRMKKHQLSDSEASYLLQRLVMRRLTRYYGVRMELIPWEKKNM